MDKTRASTARPALGRCAGRIGTLAALIAGLISGATAQAADRPAPAAPASQTAGLPAPAPGWEYQLSLYGWATSLVGDVGVRNLPTSSIDVPFSEVLNHLNGALMGSFFAQNGEWILLADVVFAKLSDARDLGTFGGSRLDAEVTQTIATGAIGRMLPTGRPDLDIAITGGVRYMSVKGALSFDPFALPADIAGSQREWWIDPTVGVFAHWELNQKWYVNAIADIGGFGVGSRLSSTGYLGVGYMWTDSFSTSLGYRYLYEDYVGERTGSGSFRYNTTMHGPTVAAAWRF
ncbi:hypothetical protein [Ancylobacter moscoviensis]